ncbi:MAG: glycosyltransferase family 2 protein [Rikenellaceae bacterium]|jgi:GT2 family glycosyltransferase|nr:glycosyltransferase family 2 protein [Rikenellaceae bacterium]
MSRIAALLTVHNRREATLRSLDALFGAALPQGCALEVFLTDDGSTDGTAVAVAARFPQVRVLHGDGELYWNRGMINSWRAAAAQADHDFYLWLNDDTFLFRDALTELLECSARAQDKAVIVGSTRSEQDGTMTYGGYGPRGLLPPDGAMQRCRMFNGNVVLAPREVFRRVGMLDPHFRHAMGDFDYGLRAARLGVEAFTTTRYSGLCERHDRLPVWCLPETPLCGRLRSLYLPLGCPPCEFFRFDRRHNGLRKALIHWFTIHLRAVSPGLCAKLKRV